MAKKVVVENAQTEVVEQETKVEKSSKVEETKVEKSNKKDKSAKNSKSTKKTKKEKKSLGKKIKESVSELKKVSWPSFGKTVKQTGMVLTVVVICTLVLFGIESLLGWLFGLLF